VDDTIAVSIFRHPLMTAMQQVTYNPGLKRYMMAVWGWVDANGNPRGQLTSSNTEGRPWEQPSTNPSVRGRKDGHDRTQLSLWEAPEPWGPWSFFHRDDDWRGPDGSSGGYTPVFPPAWISESGTELWMVFTQCCSEFFMHGPTNNYNFTYQKLTLITEAALPLIAVGGAADGAAVSLSGRWMNHDSMRGLSRVTLAESMGDEESFRLVATAEQPKLAYWHGAAGEVDSLLTAGFLAFDGGRNDNNRTFTVSADKNTMFLGRRQGGEDPPGFTQNFTRGWAPEPTPPPPPPARNWTGIPYSRGPWPANSRCPSAALMDPPGHQRGVSVAACPKGQKCSEYAYFADVSTASECVEHCCADWSCWAFSFYPSGKVGSNTEPEGPGHSCAGNTPCCVLLNDMHDAVVPSHITGAQSGVRAQLPARWDPSYEASTLISNVSFSNKLFIGGVNPAGTPVYPTMPAGGWSLGDEFPTTWADDGFQYSGAGDNFGPKGTGSPLTLWRIAGRARPRCRFVVCTAAHPLYTRFTNIFATSTSGFCFGTTMRPNPNRRPPPRERDLQPRRRSRRHQRRGVDGGLPRPRLGGRQPQVPRGSTGRGVKGFCDSFGHLLTFFYTALRVQCGSHLPSLLSF
jgi:hypothetical protein